MFFLKACSKCRGDLVMEGSGDDRWGEPADIVCIQCGHTARPAEREMLERTVRTAMRRRGMRVAAGRREPAGVR